MKIRSHFEKDRFGNQAGKLKRRQKHLRVCRLVEQLPQ